MRDFGAWLIVCALFYFLILYVFLDEERGLGLRGSEYQDAISIGCLILGAILASVMVAARRDRERPQGGSALIISRPARSATVLVARGRKKRSFGIWSNVLGFCFLLLAIYVAWPDVWDWGMEKIFPDTTP